MEEQEEQSGASSRYGIADMSGFTMSHDNRDAAVVAETRSKEFQVEDVLRSMDIEGLESIETIMNSNPRHLLTDTTIRKYAEELPEMKELADSLRTSEKTSFCRGVLQCKSQLLQSQKSAFAKSKVSFCRGFPSGFTVQKSAFAKSKVSFCKLKSQLLQGVILRFFCFHLLSKKAAETERH